MIEGLITGRLTTDPSEHTDRFGKTFMVARMRATVGERQSSAPTRPPEIPSSLFVNVVAFDPVPLQTATGFARRAMWCPSSAPSRPKSGQTSKVPATRLGCCGLPGTGHPRPKYTAQNLLKALLPIKANKKSPWIEAIQTADWSAWRSNWRPPCTPCSALQAALHAEAADYGEKPTVQTGQIYVAACINSLHFALAWKVTTQQAAIGTNSPVRGLRPGRGAF